MAPRIRVMAMTEILFWFFVAFVVLLSACSLVRKFSRSFATARRRYRIEQETAEVVVTAAVVSEPIGENIDLAVVVPEIVVRADC